MSIVEDDSRPSSFLTFQCWGCDGIGCRRERLKEPLLTLCSLDLILGTLNTCPEPLRDMSGFGLSSIYSS